MTKSAAGMGWSRRSRRTAAVGAGLAAMLVGIAVAYFLSSETFPGNTVTGGQLTVESSLDATPLTFGGEQVYPTKSEGFKDYVEDTFEVYNNNTVDVSYTIYAVCSGCAGDQEQADQYADLYVQITTTDGDPVVVYRGPLSGLSATAPASLGKVPGDGGQRAYDVRLWLKDDGAEQPQGVISLWDFEIEARTPAETAGKPTVSS